MRILSIDGGGIRGLIPALVLAEIERRTGKPIAESFDLIAGTSTGGIVASALVVPDPENPSKPRFRATDIVEVYDKFGPKIFHASPLRKLRSACGLAEARYPSTGLVEAFAQYFGDVKLSETVPGCELLVTAYDLELRDALLMRSIRARTDDSHDFLLRDVALATSSAPIFFEPAAISDVAGSQTYVLVDGGVFANNPSLCALVDQLRPDRGLRHGGGEVLSDLPKDLGESGVDLFVSLGTGSATRPISFSTASRWGALGWAPHLMEIVFDGVADVTDFQCRQLLGKRYVRLQTDLRAVELPLDGASVQQRTTLRGEARRLLREHSGDVDQIVAALS